MVDWTQPIEAVHTDGRTCPIRLTRSDPVDTEMARRISPSLDDGNINWFREDGTHRKEHVGWSIRNVTTVLTADERLARMEALTIRLAGIDAMSRKDAGELRDEARALLRPFDRALAVIQRDLPLLGDSGQRRLARDVLAAIQS